MISLISLIMLVWIEDGRTELASMWLGDSPLLSPAAAPPRRLLAVTHYDKLQAGEGQRQGLVPAGARETREPSGEGEPGCAGEGSAA